MNSFIGKIYPTTKFYWMLFLIIFSIFTPGYIFQYAIFPICILYSLFAKTTKEFLQTFFKSIFLIVLFIFLIQVFIITNDDQVPIWGFIHFSNIGLNESLSLTSKIIAISSLIMCFFETTKLKDIIFALEQAGTPRKATFLISSTIQMIPQMSKLQRTIADAQKSRGIETEGNLWVRIKAFIPMLGPLVLSSIEQTEERVLALESRAFSAKGQKTSVYVIEKHGFDQFFSLLAFVVFIVYVAWRCNIWQSLL